MPVASTEQQLQSRSIWNDGSDVRLDGRQRLSLVHCSFIVAAVECKVYRPGKGLGLHSWLLYCGAVRVVAVYCPTLFKRMQCIVNHLCKAPEERLLPCKTAFWRVVLYRVFWSALSILEVWYQGQQAPQTMLNALFAALSVVCCWACCRFVCLSTVVGLRFIIICTG